MSQETMLALRAECRKYGVRPARSKVATIARIEDASRVKGILTVRRITQGALRVLADNLAMPDPTLVAHPPSSGGPLRIRLPRGYEAAQK